MSPVKPNFFLVGAPEAGTTSLYHYLRQHPQIYMSPIKEPNYFASEIRIENFCDAMRAQTAHDVEALGEYLNGPMSELCVGRRFTPDMSERHLRSQAPQSLAMNYLLKRQGLWERLKSLCPQFLRPPLKALVFKSRGAAIMSDGDRENLASKSWRSCWDGTYGVGFVSTQRIVAWAID